MRSALKEELIPDGGARYRTSGVRSFTGTSCGGLLGGLLLNAETGEQPWYFSPTCCLMRWILGAGASNLQDEQNLRAQRPNLPIHVDPEQRHHGQRARREGLCGALAKHGFADLKLDYKSFDLKHDVWATRPSIGRLI